MATSAELITQLYIGYYNRAPDPAGLNYWVGVYNSGQSIKQIAEYFALQDESKAAYPYLANPNIADPNAFVNSIYQNLFNRAATDADKAYWVGELQAGRVTAGAFIATIQYSANVAGTGDDFTTLKNKTTVAQDYAVDLANANVAFTQASAKDVISGVTKDAASVTAGMAKTDAFIAGGGGSTQTFVLTPGADPFTGGSGTDTFNALSVKADGTAASTFTAFDTLDGGAGTDTLNIYTTGTENTAFPASGSVKNIEIVNIYNAAAAAALADASKFVGATQLWQIGAAAADVTGLAETTTAGLRGVEATVAADVDVTAAATATKVNIALDGLKGAAATGGGETQNQADLDVQGDALASVVVSGTLAQKTTTAGAAAASLVLNVTGGKDVETLSVNTAVKTTLTVTENGTSAATKDIRTLDASASAGAITFAGTVTGGTAGSLATIKTGSGDDVLTVTTATLKDDAATTTVDETVSASVESGAGKDTITINTSGTGTTTVNSGDGDDSVTLNADGSGKLTVNLGAGNDKFLVSGAGAVAAGDAIDAGEGSDTLQLSLVGAANIAAFSNFEVFDAKGLAKTLDVDILATKNTVTEFAASGDVGVGATLTNVGTGVGYRITGDTDVANALTLTQKAAGALTVTLDIDETGTTAVDSGAATNVDAALVATNATSLKAVFDSAFVGAALDATDNLTNLTVTGTKATSLEVVSGGANAKNDLVYAYGKATASAAADGLLTSVTISGDRALSVAFSDGTNDAETNLATINASALTGALTVGLDDLKATGTVTLGSGNDVITAQAVAASATAAIDAHRALSGIGKGTAEDAAAQGAFDVVKVTAAVQAADDVAGTADASVKDGLITFKGAGPSTLAEAVTFAQALIDANEAAVFEYVGNSYIFAEGGTDGAGTDVLIKLTGTTGLKGLDTVGANTDLYVF